MSRPNWFDDEPPRIEVDRLLRTAAGDLATAVAVITNTAHEPRIMAVVSLGVDAEWLPEPSRSRPLLPGESMIAEIGLHPAIGTLPARYPLAVTVQAIDPASGDAMSRVAVADVTLIVDAPGQIVVAVAPEETTARRSKRITVTLRNTGISPETVRIDVKTPRVAKVVPVHDVVEIPPGGQVNVPARIKVKFRLFGSRTRHVYTVSAHGSAAPRRADAAVTTRALIGVNGAKAVALVAVVAAWAGIGVFLIPKLASTVQNNNSSSVTKVSGLQNEAQQRAQAAKSSAEKSAENARPSSKSGSAGGSNSPGSTGGSNNAGSTGGSNNAGSTGGSSKSGSTGGSSKSGSTGGSTGPAASSNPAGKVVQFSGTVAGTGVDNATVSMRPTSLVDEQATQAQPIGVNDASFTELGKIPGQAVLSSPPTSQKQSRSTHTMTDGAWSFAQVPAPGYYLLTFAKTGYQTQRYVVDSSSAAAAQPLTVNLVPGQGHLSGQITSATGAVGGAMITITDGTNTVTTSSNSKGSIGSWSVDGLSTPSTYLVSATKNGLTSESAIVALTAGATGATNLKLTDAATTLVGQVSGADSLGVLAGLGGVQVSVSNGATTRTATTITNGNLAGIYRLPSLGPGTYTVTTSTPGYLPQTQQITIRSNEPTANLHTILTASSATVTGTVTGVQFNADGTIDTDPVTNKPVIGPIDGAGIILDSPNQKYKITSGSDGTFRVNGITPGTYVLSAQYSGLNTAYVTIKVTAGQVTQVPSSQLQLSASETSSTSTISGFVANAVDPSGTLTCPEGYTDCMITLTLTSSDGTPILIRTSSTAPYVTSPTVVPAGSGPTGYTLSAENGLPAGLYHLLIQATGYLPTTLSVRVPLNAVAQAPQANLFPTDTIKGTVSYISNPSTDAPAGGTPPYTTCVYAVPVGAGTPVPTTCDFTPPAVSVCQTRGLAETGYSLLDATAGTYSIRGLCDGTYLMYIVPTNPLFVTTTGGSVSVSRGETADYSPHLFRKGQVQLTINALDPSTGKVGPVTGTLTGTASCGGTTSADLSTIDAQSTVLIRGIDATNAGICTVSSTTPSGAALTGVVSHVIISNDTDTPATVTLTQSVGALYGQVVSSYGASKTNPVGSLNVTITATTGYDGSTPTTATASLVTDAKGCFAIGTSADPVDGGSACGLIAKGAANRVDFTDSHGAIVSLVSQTVTVTTSKGTGVTDFSSDVKFTPGTDNLVQVIAKPVSSNGLLLTSTSTSVDLSQAQIKVTPIAAVSAGAITATSDSGGRLTFIDPTYGTDTTNELSPGTYNVVASLPGYSTVPATLTCQFNASSCTLTTFQLIGLASLSGTITGVQGDTTMYSGHNYPTHPLFGATVTATCDAASTTCTGTTLTAVTDPNGNYLFGTTSQPNVLPPGTYDITISATGYGSTTQTLTYDPTSNNITTKGPAFDRDVSLFTNPVALNVGVLVAGSLYSCPTNNASCVTVSLYRLDTSQIYTATTATAGRYNFPALNPATYILSVTGDGLQSYSTQYTIQPSPPGTTLTFDAPISQVQNTVYGRVFGASGKNGATLTPVVGASVELGHLTAGAFVVDDDTTKHPLVGTTTTTPADGSFTFTNVPNGTYIARINFQTPSSSSPADAYGSTITTSFAAVSGGQSASIADTTLPPATHNVTFSITTTNSGDDVGAATPELISKTDSTFILSPGTVTATKTANAVTDTWTFTQVPAGDWTISVTLPKGHLGKPTSTSAPALSNCSPGTVTIADADTCTSASGALTVPGRNGTDPSEAYALGEFPLGVNVVATNVARDTNYPSTVSVAVKDGTTTVVPSTSTTVLTSTPTPPPFTLWAANTTTYTSVTTGTPTNYTLTEASYTSTSPTTAIALTEKSSDVTVKFSSSGPVAIPAGTMVKVSIKTPSGVTAPASQTVDATSTATFTTLPFGAYEADVTGAFSVTTPGTGGAGPTTTNYTITGSMTFNVTSTTTANVSVALTVT